MEAQLPRFSPEAASTVRLAKDDDTDGGGGGIAIDQFMRSSNRDIFAAGDCASPAWIRAPNWMPMKLWTQAKQMGHYAGKCMVELPTEEYGMDSCFELFSHITSFFGFKVVLLGLFNAQGLSGTDYDALIRVDEGREYVKVIVERRTGAVRGAILIGESDLEETLENLILTQLDVSHLGEDLINPNVDIEDYFD